MKTICSRVNVTYDGEPRFEAVPGTHVEYALNTPEQVLKIWGRYYVCDQGVWFSAGGPTGPWTLADSLPDDEIQAIPPESSVYNTRFAYVYDATPEVVYTAYTPAYLGSYPYYGTVVFGTGWAYRPWWGAYYYPRPWTWGFHARYAPWAGWGASSRQIGAQTSRTGQAPRTVQSLQPASGNARAAQPKAAQGKAGGKAARGGGRKKP